MSSHELQEDSYATALFSWKKKNEQELDLVAGEIVTILSISEDKQWVLCVSQYNERGYVPCDYLQGTRIPDIQNATSRNLEDESGYVRPRLVSSMQQSASPVQQQDVQQQGVQQQDVQKRSVVQQLAEILQEQARSQLSGSSVAQQDAQTPAPAVTLSNGPREAASDCSSGASYYSLGYETDETVCYRVVRESDLTGGGEQLAVRVGDLVLCGGERGEDAVWGTCCAHPTRGGFVPTSSLQAASSLDLQPWFLGTMTREEAETLLLSPSIDVGTFIVRESGTTGGYVISIKSSDGSGPTLRHRKCHEANGLFTAWSQMKFQDIPELVKYHSDGRELSLPYDKYRASSTIAPKNPALQPKPRGRQTPSPYVNCHLDSEEAEVPQITPTVPPRPVITNTKPVIPNTKPVMANNKPIIPNTKPIIANTQPITAHTQPITANTQPIIANTRPISASPQSNAPEVPPRQPPQTTSSLNQIHDGPQNARFRPSGPPNLSQGRGKPPPGLLKSQGLSGMDLRPVRPLMEGIMASAPPNPVIQQPSTPHEFDSTPIVPSRTDIDVPRNSVRRPMNPPPPPPATSDRALLNTSTSAPPFEADPTERNAQTSDPSSVTRAQAYIQAVGVPLHLAALRPPLLQSISVPHAPEVRDVAPPVRSLTVPQLLAAQKESGAIPKPAPRDASAREMYAEADQAPAPSLPPVRPRRARQSLPPKNQEELRAIELENRAMESEFESWRVIRMAKIGSGHYGEVWKVKIKNTQTIMALKTFNKERMEEKLFLDEAKTMMALKHPNLVKLRAVCSEPQSIFMLLDLHSLGSVLDYLTRGLTLRADEKLNVMKGVLSGMKYLSEEGFVHRDLAARNVLMADDKTPKVADFGLAQMIKADGRAEHDNQKTPWKWTAPEALCGGNLWTSKCDVWSYGVFCWELYSNCTTQPYPEINNSRSLLRSLRAGTRPNKPLGCDDTIFGIIYQCWEFDHSARPSFEDLWRFFNP